MTPTVEAYIRLSVARKYNITHKFTMREEMVKWKEAEWRQFQLDERQAIVEHSLLEEARKFREYQLDEFTKACEGDVDMATDIVEGGIPSFHMWACRMSLTQFQAVAGLLFNSSACGGGYAW